MLPNFNSLPYHRPNKVPTVGPIAASTSHQAISSDHCQGNPSNLFAQTQSQMGLINPQTATPFDNSTTYHMGNNRPMVLSNRPMGAPNHYLPMQTGMPVLGSTIAMPHLGQYPGGGFCPQNLNPMSVAPMNLIQSPNQFFAHHSGNLPQYPSPNPIFLNGQFCLQNPMQAINQFVQMPQSNCGQPDPRSMHLYSNQVSQGLAPQNPTFFPNPQFGILHTNAGLQPNQDQHKLALSRMGANATAQSHNATAQSHNNTQGPQGNSPLPPSFASALPQHTQKDFHSSGSTEPQRLLKRYMSLVETVEEVARGYGDSGGSGNLRKDSGINNWNNNWKNSQNRKFTRDLTRDESQRGFSKPQFHNVQNAKRKFSFHNEHGGKGKLANSTNQAQVVQRRESVYLIVGFVLLQKLAETDVIVKDAMLRRQNLFWGDNNQQSCLQRLKEILAKQAELGCEVAEIPPCYLSDSEKRGCRKEVGNKALTKENFRNKYNKRGRFHRKGTFSKKQQLADRDSSNLTNPDEQFSKKQKLRDNDSRTMPYLNKKQPTLLQRLLSADIRRDKHRLLQVFRFMVINSFFKDLPEKPLRFPLVRVNNNTSEGEVVEGKLLSPGNGVSEACDKTASGETEYGDYPDDEEGADYEREHDALAEEAALFVSSKGGEPEELEEEEGEIID
ncbi:hypothetical protein RHMOL_Rhmol01G0127500 [Rhododendron molle]|uniref:Uncharacterized protein n=1 Tax=Rhododendron molle TaxID=49168 RepID=A0ACC0Q2S2_RHOML|nr:hypothetical protein RHMOL_Rhmol01G0127500 [Rhododendron molle]